MGLNSISIRFDSKRVCSALRNYLATGHVDEDELRVAYTLLSTCRYISDPMNYAVDHDAIADSQAMLNVFHESLHDMQVLLTSARIIVDSILMGSSAMDARQAIVFFTVMGEVPVEDVQEPETVPADVVSAA